MKEWLSQYGYLILVFFAVLAIFIVVLNFAAKAYSKHMKSFKAEEAEIKRLTALKEKYKDLSEEAISSAPDEELLEGVALIYQLFLQKKDNVEEEFLKLSSEIQSIYVLDVFVADGGVEEFFTANTNILRMRLVPALELIGLNEDAKRLSAISRMYDEDDYEASFSRKKLEDADKFFRDSDILSRIKLNSAKYIKENVSLLKF
ncbi:MAG: hypothetical protein IIX98_05515 [Clostridia bacterium]|nr:hypothetical protein [Clostridia bacterium]MBQ1995495.1 hypothetical protein [Clostridia bacterium]MBQ5905125.1 hypothetical protein [Clostridia bacterium]